MNGFSWIVPQRIAGMACPPYDANDEFWKWIRDQGVTLVVTLTSAPIDGDAMARQGIEWLHLPIEDFTPPDRETVDKFLEQARFCDHEDRAMVVHCAAGRGRTGTMLACWLVDHGHSADEAIEKVRSMRPGSIETPEQERAIRELETRLRSQE